MHQHLKKARLPLALTCSNKNHLGDSLECFCSLFTRTAHEASHERAEERLNKMKWPWEREGAGSGTEDTPVKGPEAAAKR